MAPTIRLALPTGPVRLTAAQWRTLVAIAARVQTDAAWLPRDLCPGQRTAALAHLCERLAATGVLERTPAGFRLPHAVRDAVRRLQQEERS
jgi:hypothetical protein